MQLSKIKVDNFKSLVGFEIDLARFNCIIGLNGSGKSTFLQFVDFLVHLMKGDVAEWFKRRNWDATDIYNRLDRKQSVQFTVELAEGKKTASWSATYSIKKGCRNEEICVNGLTFSTVNRQGNREYKLKSADGKILHRGLINFEYEGSIFSVLKDKEIPGEFYAFRDHLLNIESFELLTPHFLRQRSRQSDGSMGLEGKELASFLFTAGKEVRQRIARRLAKVYPHLHSLDIRKLRAGWKQLDVEEAYAGKTLKTGSRHVNDGMLRLIAILAQLYSPKEVLIFDEIENGINQELIEFLLEEFVRTKKQIIVTTHSPLFLNYLEDALAEESILYFYKTPEGYTRCVPFFSLPTTRKKLGTLGPGEAVADTDLLKLNAEILRKTQKEA